MKKFVPVILFVMFCAASASAEYDMYSDNVKVSAFNAKIEALTSEVQKLGDRITAYNKPVYEAELTDEEREYIDYDGEDYSPIRWSRVYAKDNTLVLGYAQNDKKFRAQVLITSDKEFKFAKNIHAGADEKVLEEFFGDSIKNMGRSRGKATELYGYYDDGPIPARVFITCEDGKITTIKYEADCGPEFIASREALKFLKEKADEMNLTGINELLPR